MTINPDSFAACYLTRQKYFVMDLIGDSQTPAVPPEKAYVPSSDVVAWREMGGGYAYLEIFKRSSGAYGYRFQAWVAWRDAGKVVRSHDWYEVAAKDALYSDSLSETCELADAAATELSLSLSGEWKHAV